MVLSLWLSHCESSPGSRDGYRAAPVAADPWTKPIGLSHKPASKLHPPSPFIIITQPEIWYSFYRLTEGRRLSRPRWLATYPDALPRPIYPQTVTHPIRNQAQCRLTSLNKANVPTTHIYVETSENIVNRHFYNFQLSLHMQTPTVTEAASVNASCKRLFLLARTTNSWIKSRLQRIQ